MSNKPPEILKVKDLDGDERFTDLHPNLPRPPSCFIIVGAIKSSKSNLIINCLCNPSFYKDRFSVVRVLSTTLHMDNKMKILNKHFDCDDHYEDSFIQDIIHAQGMYDKDDPNKPTYCLVLDDIITPEFSKRSSALSYFMCKMRHYIDMCIISVQSINHIPPLIRAQTRDIAIGKQQNFKEVIKLQEQYGGLFGENGDKKFLELYNQVHKDKPYQFFYIKLSENPIQAFHNFTKRIY